MSVELLGARVLLKDLEEEHVTSGGIIVTQFRDPRIKRAEVQAVGPGEVSDSGSPIPVDPRLEPGVVVYYDTYGSTIDFNHEGEQLVIVPEEIVLAVENG